MPEKTSQELFEELHRELGERGLHGSQRKLEQWRAQVQAEQRAEVSALLQEHLARLDEDLVDPPQPALAAGQIEGEQAQVSPEGRAGLPADQAQPTQPIP